MGTLPFLHRVRLLFPDTKCDFDGNVMFIEVAHLYGITSDAKRLLGRTGKSYPSVMERKRARFTPLRVRIGQKFVEILQQKCKKTYATDSVWLLIRNANPLWSCSDF